MWPVENLDWPHFTISYGFARCGQSEFLREICAHHVWTIAAVAYFIHANAFAIDIDGLVSNTNRRFDEVVDEGLIRGFAGKVATIDGSEQFLIISVESYSRNNVTTALDRGIRHSEHIPQEAPDSIASVRGFTELHTSPGRTRPGYFQQTVHRT